MRSHVSTSYPWSLPHLFIYFLRDPPSFLFIELRLSHSHQTLTFPPSFRRASSNVHLAYLPHSSSGSVCPTFSTVSFCYFTLHVSVSCHSLWSRRTLESHWTNRLYPPRIPLHSTVLHSSSVRYFPEHVLRLLKTEPLNHIFTQESIKFGFFPMLTQIQILSSGTLFHHQRISVSKFFSDFQKPNSFLVLIPIPCRSRTACILYFQNFGSRRLVR